MWVHARRVERMMRSISPAKQLELEQLMRRMVKIIESGADYEEFDYKLSIYVDPGERLIQVLYDGVSPAEKEQLKLVEWTNEQRVW